MADDALPGRTALVFFDMLKRYDYGPDLKSLSPEARPQVEACVRLMNAARAAGIPVVYAAATTAGWPRPRDGDHRRRSRSKWRAPRTGPGGQAIIDELAPQRGDYVIRKHRWSMFFQTELELSLRARDIQTILLTGGSTEVGIASSCYAARDLDFNTILVRECLRSGRGQHISDFFIDRIAGNLARVRSLDAVLGMLSQVATRV